MLLIQLLLLRTHGANILVYVYIKDTRRIQYCYVTLHKRVWITLHRKMRTSMRV